jgi:hypothetical protein
MLKIIVAVCASYSAVAAAQNADVAEVTMPKANFSTSSSALPDTAGMREDGASGGGAKSPEASMHPFSKVGIGINVGLGGAGFEVATPLARKLNLRGGGNFFGYNTTITDNGISYTGNLQLRSGKIDIDWFPFGGSFRLSGGVEIYNGNQITATATVPSQQSFTVNGDTYYSSASNPLTGSASLVLGNKAGPSFSLGWGNLVPRKAHSHFSVPFEIGAVYTGTPVLKFNFSGSACTTNLTPCTTGTPVATNSTFQQDLAGQINTYQNDLNVLRLYPILSIGLGYKF